MFVPAVLARLERWMQSEYQAVIFEDDLKQPIGYALYRPGDPDQQGPNAIYLRQFFIVRQRRKQRLGTAAFELLRRSFPGNQTIILEVLTKNPRGHHFWQSIGFGSYSNSYHQDSG